MGPIEQEIRVLLTPHTWDNRTKPYFWVIMNYYHDSGWCNSGICGWENTPQKAWEQAYKEFNKK
jgi:hypothetical protein